MWEILKTWPNSMAMWAMFLKWKQFIWNIYKQYWNYQYYIPIRIYKIDKSFPNLETSCKNQEQPLCFEECVDHLLELGLDTEKGERQNLRGFLGIFFSWHCAATSGNAFAAVFTTPGVHGKGEVQKDDDFTVHIRYKGTTVVGGANGNYVDDVDVTIVCKLGYI